jgi:hypothetical protein
VRRWRLTVDIVTFLAFGGLLTLYRYRPEMPGIIPATLVLVFVHLVLDQWLLDDAGRERRRKERYTPRYLLRNLVLVLSGFVVARWWIGRPMDLPEFLFHALIVSATMGVIAWWTAAEKAA